MSDLIILLVKAKELKPKMGEECNHCGFCCLMEVCVVGQELTGKHYGRCDLLITDGDKHYCRLGTDETSRKVLGIGEGCCTETQEEATERYFKEHS